MKRRKVLTYAGGGGRRSTAFTMAEILLSLTIIGVVAVITLPSLTGNINERTWNTQRKALYARFSQAIALMPALNGYGTLDDTTDTAAETFVTAGLSKVLKINNICDNEHLKDCGIPETFTTLDGSEKLNVIGENGIQTLHGLNSAFRDSYLDSETGSYNSCPLINTKAVAFETVNGESVLAHYNPSCIVDLQDSGLGYLQPKLCANFIYDLNGNKGPNTVGKDIGFLTAMYASDTVVVSPMPLVKDSEGSTNSLARSSCKELDTDSRLPNRDELAALFYNKRLINNLKENWYWSSSSKSPTQCWRVEITAGRRFPATCTNHQEVRCVKR